MESTETDGTYSLDSFNTEKIRRENLSSNFGNAGGREGLNHVLDSSPDQLCCAENGIVSFSGNVGGASAITFGPTSSVGNSKRASKADSTPSSQLRPPGNPLAGLQEIYSVHQYNLGAQHEQFVKKQ